MSEDFDYTTPFLFDVDHSDAKDCWCEPDLVEIGDLVIVRHNRGVC